MKRGAQFVQGDEYWLNLRQDRGQWAEYVGWFWTLPEGSTRECQLLAYYAIAICSWNTLTVDPSAATWQSGEPDDSSGGEDSEEDHGCLKAGELDDENPNYGGCKPLCQFPFGEFRCELTGKLST